MTTDRCDLAAVARGWSGIAAGRGCPVGGIGTLQTRACRRLVVAVTHLGEDVGAAGGLIARLAELGVPIDVLAVTDGDGATAGAARATPPHELGRRRAHQLVSYQQLGAHHVRRHELGLPSGGVADAEPDVVAALSEIIGFDADPSRSWMLAPWRHDGQPDHDAVGRASATVCLAYRVRLVEYLVAAWGQADLQDVPWSRARQLPLSPLLHLRKLRAVCPPGLGQDGLVPGSREIYLTPEGQVRPERRRRRASVPTTAP